MVHPILIAGKWIAAQAAQTLEIINPATLEKLGAVSNCGAADVNGAVMAARQAQKAWWRLAGPEKANLLHEIAKRMRQHGHRLAVLMTQETGKPLIESIDCVEWVAANFDYYAEVGRASRGGSFPPVAAHQLNFTIKEPFGVVAAIAPFNFPLLLMAWKLAPALMAGNTIVAKPPHQNPLANLEMAKIMAEILPPGVLNMVTGDGPTTGELLIQHPEVNLIAFTGSTKVGKHIAAVAGAQLKRVNLELGGIDPLLVFEDANLDIAARGAAWARLLNAGQVCTSAKRIYVVEKIAAEFIQRIVAHVKTLVVGNPMKSETDIGPLITREALVAVAGQVKALEKEGARLLLGGTSCAPDGLPGYFFEPTVMANVRHGGIATTEEIFGPVICIIPVKDHAQAITLANDSEYGLGASVYTNNLEYAMKAAEEIKAGSFWINDPLSDNDAAPFGGMRNSGIGRELGEEGLDAFREPKHIHIDYIMEAKYYWYPYKNRPISKT